MSLITCKLCGRLFDSTRGKICTQCLEELDDFYPKVREYIRDHRDARFSVDTLADDMGVDILRVQTLVELGYLDRDVPGLSSDIDDEKKKKEALRQQLKVSLNPTPPKRDQQDDAKSSKMYGQERYGTGKKR